ncbi:MAG: nitroreductase family protein [Peptococcaceae bacterium]|nr:nitroreductase family protein [Peptococcaceae bacterium]
MDLRRVIRERRSIRRFEDREVPRELLEEILADALWAPSGMNRQEWEIIAVRGEMKNRLLEVIAGAGERMKPRLEKLFPEKMVGFTLQFFKNLGGAPVVLLVYIPRVAVELRPDMSGPERYHVEHDRLSYLLSAAALVQNILLLARERGLGTCWMTGPKYAEDRINELLGIQDKELVAVIPVGYPGQEPPVPPRKGEKIRWVGFA